MATSPYGNCGDELVRITSEDSTADFLDNKIDVDETWIEKETVSEGSSQTLKINHIGPGEKTDATSTPTLSLDDYTLTLTAKPVAHDEKGHITGEDDDETSEVTLKDEKVKVNSSDPTAGYLADKIESGNHWINVATASNKVRVSHENADASTSVTYNGVASASINGSDQLSIVPNQLQFDSKGHQRSSVQAGTAVTCNLISIDIPTGISISGGNLVLTTTTYKVLAVSKGSGSTLNGPSVGTC